MLYSIKGRLIHTETGVTVIECSGVGFKCFTSNATQRALPLIGENVMLFTHLNVREDALDLFGFSSKQELNCFKLLTSVSGVGPKAALSILSELTAEQLSIAVAASDVKAITRAQGVGPKIAQRIITELKDKLSLDFDPQGNNNNIGAPMQNAISAGNLGEAINALTVLGYQPSDAAKAVSGLDATKSVEQLITLALRNLGGF